MPRLADPDSFSALMADEETAERTRVAIVMQADLSTQLPSLAE